MLELQLTSGFKKDYKRVMKRGYSEEKFKKVIDLLLKEQPLPEKYCDHALTNSRKYHNSRECHIQPNWLLVYRVDDNLLILELLRTGTHSDLF